MSEAKLLSECGDRYVVDEQDRYEVKIEPGEFLLVEAGACAGKLGAKFRHPNVAATVRRLYEFKHYHRDGGKSWSTRAGVSYYMVIPRTAVRLLPEKGCSYVPAEINGVKVSFNVSGGGGEVWTDYLRTRTQIAVNHPLRALKAMAAVAVRGTPFEPVAVEPLTPEQEEQWDRLAAGATPDIKEKIARMVEAGLRPTVRLLPGYRYCLDDSGPGVETQRRYRKVWQDREHRAYRLVAEGAVRGIVLDIGGVRVRAKDRQIDWAATAKANGLAA